jgi:hypothetical protein
MSPLLGTGFLMDNKHMRRPGHTLQLLSTLILLSGVGTTCFHHDKDSAIIFTTGRLTSTLLETEAGASDCKYSRTNCLTCLPKHFDHPSYDWTLRTLRSFRDRTLSALTDIYWEQLKISTEMSPLKPAQTTNIFFFSLCRAKVTSSHNSTWL